MSEYEPRGFKLGSVLAMYNAVGHGYKHEVSLKMDQCIQSYREEVMPIVESKLECLKAELASTPIKK